MDQHLGFNDFVQNQDGFNKLGFTALGENISYGYKLNGVHIIEWMYAGDQPHNDNQLDNRWNYVGIGVDGLATCLILVPESFRAISKTRHPIFLLNITKLFLADCCQGCVHPVKKIRQF